MIRVHTLSFAHIFYKTKKNSTYGGLIKYILYEVYTSMIRIYNILYNTYFFVDYLILAQSLCILLRVGIVMSKGIKN